LVRGRPFDELAQGQWVVFEGFLAEIERSVASVALMLGDVALEAGDAELCAWAAQQALKACPFDERLHRMLMRAADALGNRAGVESTLRQLALILEIDGNPLHGVHPKTAKLYHELTATSVSRA
jgi:DNA-binding SARP family transcriptional activator